MNYRIIKVVFLLMILQLCAGCAEEKKRMIIPVSTLSPNYMEQKAEMKRMLSEDFPKLAPNELDAIDSIPRMLFVTPEARHRAYTIKTQTQHSGNRQQIIHTYYALPIGSGQSMLRLSDIGFLLTALKVRPTDHIFEVGTGTGYLTAILGRISAQVYSMDIIEQLVETAWNNMERNNLSKEQVRICRGNGLTLHDELAEDATANEIETAQKNNLLTIAESINERINEAFLHDDKAYMRQVSDEIAQERKVLQRKACIHDGRNGMVGYAPYDIILITTPVKGEIPKDLRLLLAHENARLAAPITNDNGNTDWVVYHYLYKDDKLEEITRQPLSANVVRTSN